MDNAKKICLIGNKEIFAIDLIDEFIKNSSRICLLLGDDNIFNTIDDIYKRKVNYIKSLDIQKINDLIHTENVNLIITSSYIAKNIKLLRKEKSCIYDILSNESINILTYINITDFPIQLLKQYVLYYDKVVFVDKYKRQEIEPDEMSNIGFLFEVMQRAQSDKKDLEKNQKKLQVLNDAIIDFSFDDNIEKIAEKSIKTCLDITSAQYGSITILFNDKKIEKEYTHSDIDITYSYRIHSNNEIVGILTLGYKEASYKGKENDYIINLICSSIGDFIYTFMKKEEGKRLKASTNKIKIMGEIAGGIVHDLNNVFAIIKGYTQILQISSDAYNIKEYIDTIADVTKEGIDKIKIIQDFSRNIPEEKKKIKINDIISRAIQTSRPKWENSGYISGKSIDIALSMKSQKEVLVKENEIKEALINILFNSVDAMENGGCIYINTYDEEKNVVIEVIDEGEGIDKDVIDNVFDPFFTTKEKSTGLGLSLVKKNVESNGGEVFIESKKNEMTKCTIKIPIMEG
ncbi:Histidine kinase-, DNA gyrase B-, and HSP90-like ATPase [Alkalithermobacter thermoalcaliphilus JW-YL-7 = DSM 7308]|uniref:histidine kinase n=1 Tax=Alkalithermobacter thermoalcaliphilus JW-YL-7 = DSM 7308 TaxID=1121328 RepID=A0A150FNE3_CLOPD|nr:ATP-binding region ATPase domain protein [[Clostridium] paradoxum JW-YL-7 = DSM 7308]SHL06630.1 Histidine kinase-, DNA gyrase B-, and HSP90-like ATPase [[Clostridium] paradoxum JW-YL-7 = DSM 7308]